MKGIYNLLGRLEGVKGKTPQWSARCPSHEDKSPSLRIRETDDGRILIYCHAGCGASDIVQSLGLTLASLFPNGKLGDYLPGKTRKYREPEAVYGVAGANKMAQSLQAKNREIESLKARLK